MSLYLQAIYKNIKINYMKKYLLLSLLSFATFVSAFGDTKEVKLSTNNASLQSANKAPRIPMRIPEASIEDHTLFFDLSCIGCSIQLLQDDVMVYSDVVDENGEVQLPANLSGVYQLQLQFGSITFVGEIEL